MVIKRTVRPVVESRQVMLARTEAELMADATRRADLAEALNTLLVQVWDCENFARVHPLTIGSTSGTWRHF